MKIKTPSHQTALRQCYMSILSNPDMNCGVQYIVFPARCFSEEPPLSADGISESFGIPGLARVRSVSLLARKLAHLLEQEMLGGDRMGRYPRSGGPESSDSIMEYDEVLDPSVLAFAEEAVFADVIPFEASPIAAQSLARIAISAAKAGPVPLGAATAYIAFGPTPMLIVAVPTGIVLCGAAGAMSRWLIENRDEIFRRILGLRRRR